MEILVGADPEVFVFDKNQGKVVNAHDMVKGTKVEPFPVVNGAVQVDGMALEFNIDPAKTMEEFVTNIESVQQQLSEMIGLDKYDLMAIPSTVFSEDDMKEAPLVSKRLGCDPDFNAWRGGEVNPTPNASTNMRTGAGHLHVGWCEGENPNSIAQIASAISVIKQLDCSLGVQSLLWDNDNDRRDLYGKAGAFRSKSYGCEYRVLSNSWLGTKELVGHVYNVTRHAVQDLMDGNRYYDKFQPEHIINSGDTMSANIMAKKISADYGVPAYG